jgi:hypothetical protein
MITLALDTYHDQFISQPIPWSNAICILALLVVLAWTVYCVTKSTNDD